jgi:hypothetical protein
MDLYGGWEMGDAAGHIAVLCESGIGKFMAKGNDSMLAGN